MIDIIHTALTWLLTWEVVALLAGLLIKLGMPAEAAPLLIIGVALFLIYKVRSDQYMLQRWRFKMNRWRR